jgi:hypothetical protein
VQPDFVNLRVLVSAGSCVPDGARAAACEWLRPLVKTHRESCTPLFFPPVPCPAPHWPNPTRSQKARRSTGPPTPVSIPGLQHRMGKGGERIWKEKGSFQQGNLLDHWEIFQQRSDLSKLYFGSDSGRQGDGEGLRNHSLASEHTKRPQKWCLWGPQPRLHAVTWPGRQEACRPGTTGQMQGTEGARLLLGFC